MRINRQRAERVGWVTLLAVAFAAGNVSGAVHPGVTLQPGDSITISAATLPPSPTPTPTIAPTPSPTPTVSPTPTPSPGDPWAIPFGTRPSSGPIALSNCNNVVIENKTFRDLGPNVIAISLQNCTNVTIRQVDFIDVAEGVYAGGGSDITIQDSRYRNILGPFQRDGHNRANFVQLNGTARGLVKHNKGKCGDTEDIVSFTGSTNNSIAEDNWFEGALTDTPDGPDANTIPDCIAWKSASGSAIATSDGSGSGNIARRNTVLNPGQVGIFLSGGTNGHIDDNLIMGQQRPLANVGAYIYGTTGCGDTFLRNRINWSRADGGANPYYDRPGDGCSPDETGSTPEGGRDTTLDPNAYHVQL